VRRSGGYLTENFGIDSQSFSSFLRICLLSLALGTDTMYRIVDSLASRTHARRYAVAM
jgi:hypothetical protein